MIDCQYFLAAAFTTRSDILQGQALKMEKRQTDRQKEKRKYDRNKKDKRLTKRRQMKKKTKR